MHIRPVTKVDVAPAQSIEVVLDIIAQFLAVIGSLQTTFDFTFKEVLGNLIGKNS